MQNLLGDLSGRLHLDPLFWLMEKSVLDLQLDLARNMEVVMATMETSGMEMEIVMVKGQARARIPRNLTRRLCKSQ